LILVERYLFATRSLAARLRFAFRKFSLVLLGCFLSFSALAQPVEEPKMKCASVALNGDVTLNWVKPDDPSGLFVSYDIYSSTVQGGPYTNIATVALYNQESYTHIGANAHNAQRFYYVITNSTFGGGSTSPPSDTLQSLFLQLNNPGTGVAQLYWNHLATNNIVTSSGWYLIYQEYPVGTWTLIDSVPYPTQNYTDTISVCSDTLNYKIVIDDLSGCSSESSIEGDWFSDVTAPMPPPIVAATVDTASGSATIDWEPSYSQDTEGYIIMQFINGNWVIIDTIWGYNNTIYTNTGSLADLGCEQYGVLAFDSCWTGIPPSPNTSAIGTTHKTIHLTSSLAVCDREVNLQWNAYTSWSEGVLHYEIYSSQDGAPYVLVTTVPGTLNSFIHNGAAGNSNYCYLVKAVSNAGKESLSNLECLLIYQPPRPAFGYMQTATVQGSGDVTLRYHADQAAAINHYRFERAEQINGPFDLLGTTTGTANPMSYIDQDADSDDKSYYYRVTVIDSCGNIADSSNTNKTILLSGTADSDLMTNRIYWTHFEGWDGVRISYNIYRSVDGIWGTNPIATVPGNIREYTDDVTQLLDREGEFCYYVEAIESVNSYSISESAHSNTTCIYQEPKVWIPNALVVDGVNPIWKPVVGNIEFSTYKAAIYNKWNQQIFYTEDYNLGWDATYKGSTVPLGVYLYYVAYYNAEGRFIERKGWVTVVR
jgi:gliding motility-associated-like protein